MWSEPQAGHAAVTFGQGSSGTAGADGTMSAGSVRYGFDTDLNTSGAGLTYPGVGDLKFNQTNLGNATEVFIHPQDSEAKDVSGFIKYVDG